MVKNGSLPERAFFTSGVLRAIHRVVLRRGFFLRWRRLCGMLGGVILGVKGSAGDQARL